VRLEVPQAALLLCRPPLAVAHEALMLNELTDRRRQQAVNIGQTCSDMVELGFSVL